MGKEAPQAHEQVEAVKVKKLKEIEDPKAVVDDISRQYQDLALDRSSDASTWLQLEKQFQEFDAVEDSNDVPLYTRAEFKRKQAYALMHALTLKYEAQNVPALGYPISRKMPKLTTNERKQGRREALRAVKLYEESLRMFTKNKTDQREGSHAKAIRGYKEGAKALLRMFDEYESTLEKTNSSIVRNAKQNLKQTFGDNADEITIEISDGEITATVLHKEKGVLTATVKIDRDMYSKTHAVGAEGEIDVSNPLLSAVNRGLEQ